MSKLFQIILVSFMLPLIGSIVAIETMGSHSFLHKELHLIVEAFGSFIALIAIPIILTNKRLRKDLNETQVILLCSAISSMAIIDLFHAISSETNSFIWLHSLATFIGGLLFSTMWLKQVNITHPKPFLYTVIFSSGFLGLISIAFPEYVPNMATADGFSFTAQILNILGGGGFILGALLFIANTLDNDNKHNIYLASHCALFGVAGLLFQTSVLWDASWWWWHILRLCAYLALVYFYFSSWGQEQQKEKNNYLSLPTILLIIVIFIGLTVITGWYINNTALIQVFEGRAPMQFNTALCFILASISGLLYKKPKLQKVPLLLLTTLVTLTAIEYLFQLDFSIDNLFIDSYIQDRVSHLGRMSEATTLCFILYAMCLLFSKNVVIFHGTRISIFVVALTSFITNVIKVEDFGIFNAFTGMAIHTSIAFLLLFSAARMATKKASKNEVWHVAPYIISITTLVITFFAWYSTNELSKGKTKAYFESLVTTNEIGIKERYSAYENALLGAAGFIKGSNTVTYYEWQQYVQTLNLKKYLPGANGLGFINAIPANKTAEYINEVREDRGQDFTIKPKTNAPEKFIIRYIEPEETNQEAIGLDIAFEQHRKEAAIAARDSGDIYLTRRIFLVQDQLSQSGFLLLAPVYETIETPQTVEERRKLHLGWAYSPFMARDFLENLQKDNEKLVNYNVYDGENTAEENQIYSNNNTVPASVEFAHLSKTSVISLGERKWTIVWHPSTYFTPPHNKNIAEYILILGIILSFSFHILAKILSVLYASSLNKIHQQTNMLKSIFENSSEAIITINPQGDILQANNTTCYLFNLSHEELKKSNIEYLVSYRYKDALFKAIDKLNNKQETNIYIEELKAKSINSDAFIADTAMTRIELEDGHIITCNIRNVSERQKAKEKIIASERFLTLVMDIIPDYIIIKDDKFRIVRANKAFSSLYPPEQQGKIIGHTTVEDYAPEEASKFLEMDRRALKEGFVDYEETLHLPNGEKQILNTKKISFKDYKNDDYVMSLSRNITDYVQTDMIKNDFISTVNHEMRTPLTSIQGSLGLLKVMLKDNTDKKTNDILTMAYESCERLTHLVNDILDIEKIEAGKIDFKLEVTEMVAFTGRVIERHLNYAQKYNVTFEYEPLINEAYCLIDPSRYNQAIVNLLSNAAKFSTAGQSIVIRIDKKGDSKIIISVEDQGIGIPDQFKRKVFDKFTQADASSSREHEGSGLGLNITKSIVEAFYGDIYFESEEGIGTTFFIELPINEEEENNA